MTLSYIPQRKRARSAAFVIATFFCSDIADVTEGRYQYGRTSIPVYVIGNNYYCCPPEGSTKLPQTDKDMPWDWKPIGEMYSRTVYEAKPTSGRVDGGML